MPHKILHVTEVSGAGTANAIESFTRNTPQYVHHVASPCLTGKLTRGNISLYLDLPKGHFKRIGYIKNLVASTNYSLIHAHSSFAGAYVRIALSSKKIPIIYSPHCFAFERQDINRIYRYTYWCVEKLLTRRTSAIAACSQREASLVRELNPNTYVTFVPNIALPIPRHLENWVWKKPGSTTDVSVAMVGRLSSQKDPVFFLSTVRNLCDRGINVTAIWFGEGDEAQTNLFVKNNIEVTGWIDSKSILDRLASSNAIYLHTALWEGMPLSLLEAVKLGCPVIVRNIPAFHEINLPDIYKIDTPDEAANVIQKLLLDGCNAETVRNAFSVNADEIQAIALIDLYEKFLHDRIINPAIKYKTVL